MAKENSCLTRVATGAAIGGAIGGAVGALFDSLQPLGANFPTDAAGIAWLEKNYPRPQFERMPGLLKIRHVGQTTLSSAALFGLFLGAGSLIHCGRN